MKEVWNETEHKKEWVLNNWGEKTALVVGYIWLILFGIGVVFGLFGSMFNS